MQITTDIVALPSASTERPFLSCRVAGPIGAPLLLFLHGFPEAAFVWDALITRFADRYRCVAPNLRGYAGSFAPADIKAYRANVVLGDLLALIQQQAATPQTPAAAVIAHDWGGALAWGLAAVMPQCLQRLVILNAPHPGLFLKALRDDPVQQAASDYMNLLRTPGIEPQLSANDFQQMWPFFERFGGATWLTPALRDQYRAAWSATPQACEGVEAAASALTGPLNYYRASPLHPPTSPDDAIHSLQLPDALLHVQVPTTVIWGEADTALPASLLDGLEAYVKDLHVVRLPRATHWLVHEAPQEVGDAIDAALQRAHGSPLITVDELRALQQAAGRDCLVLDCRFNLADVDAGEAAWREGHVPGALHAHLDRDLSGPKTGRNGRHPMPSPEAFAQTLGRWGLRPETEVVAYDASGGMFAARLWWLLRWAGHARVRVLDGGWQAWQAAGGVVEAGTPAAHPPQHMPVHPQEAWVVNAEQVMAALGQPSQQTLIDARAPDRFRGENETLDPVGGHIPGARNRFFQLNLQADGRFKPAAVLREEFHALLEGVDIGSVVHQCGSGVTACHNLLAMAHAGLPETRLYAGSWSEWCADPRRPVAR